MTEQPPGPPFGSQPPPPPQGGGYPPPQPPSAPPPQGGGYQTPPPQRGGYPPAPQQGGGYPPPGGGYPPAGVPGYGGYGTQQPYSVGDAFSWAWNKFGKNAGPLIVATLVYAVIMFVIATIFAIIAVLVSPETATTITQYDNGVEVSSTREPGFATWIVIVIGLIVLAVVFAAIQSAYTSGLLEIADGRQVTYGSFFSPRRLGSVFVAGVIVNLAVLVAAGLTCGILGIVVAFFTMFTIYVLLDRNLSPVEAIKASFEITRRNAGHSIVALLIGSLIAYIGAWICYVGIIVTAPVGALFLVYSYRRISGGQIAPLTP
jgi:uncharacterized membrane protein